MGTRLNTIPLDCVPLGGRRTSLSFGIRVLKAGEEASSAPYSAPPPRRPRPGREGPPRAQGNPSEERTPLPRRPGKEGGARMRSGQRPTPHCSFQTGRRRLAAGTCWRKSCWLVLIGRATPRTSHPAKLQLPECPHPSHQLCGFSPNYAVFLV